MQVIPFDVTYWKMGSKEQALPRHLEQKFPTFAFLPPTLMVSLLIQLSLWAIEINANLAQPTDLKFLYKQYLKVRMSLCNIL